ncbi:MAG TPA: permease prefix domain 1-containing protein [Bryobacteraceae bacterium]|nr:permease prefix domain 1-containing protein [Bryobacteraceae bacterium]
MSWWQRLWRRARMEEQLDKELRFHLEQHAADLMARGAGAEEARRQARQALGGEQQVKERCRDARGTRWVEDLAQDFRYALRGLLQRPAFAAVALATLALGIGATTVMFTLIHGVLLKPLPYLEPGRLVRVHGHSDTWNAAVYGEQNLANFDFRDCQRQSRSLEMAGWLWDAGTLSEPGEPEYVVQIELSSNMFSMLGVPLFRGRAFLPDEDRPGGGDSGL